MIELEQKAFAYLDERFEEALDFWMALVKKESPFWDKAAVDAACELLYERCAAHGLYLRLCPCKSTGNGFVASTQPLSQYEGGLAFMAHLDTVHQPGAFGTQVLHRRGGWMYGPGVGDCKGGAVMALYTVLALRHAGYTQRPLKLIFVGNEEGGRPEEENFLPAELSGSAALFNCETGMAGAVVTSRKASIGAVFTVRGRAGHVGHLQEQPASAIREAAYKILSLEALSDYHDHVFSCGEITGGSIFTSVPDTCTFKVNCRIRSAEDIEWLKSLLEETARTVHVPGTATSLACTGNPLPMAACAGNDALFARFSAASAALGYGSPRPVHSGGGSDASYAVRLGIPSICATGVVAENAHTCQERANVESLRQRARIHVRTVLDFPREGLDLQAAPQGANAM